MPGKNLHPSRFAKGVILTALLGFSGASPVAAQSNNMPESSDEYVASLKTCQEIEDDSERLACFDRSVTELVNASEAGEVRVIDREDIRNTRRQLFGLSVPEVGVLERGKDEDKEAGELLETTITSVRYLSPKKIRFTTQEGAVWEIPRAPRRLREVKAGQPVVFKKAALGSFFIRIDGQMGVKGKRIR